MNRQEKSQGQTPRREPTKCTAGTLEGMEKWLKENSNPVVVQRIVASMKEHQRKLREQQELERRQQEPLTMEALMQELNPAEQRAAQLMYTEDNQTPQEIKGLFDSL